MTSANRVREHACYRARWKDLRGRKLAFCGTVLFGFFRTVPLLFLPIPPEICAQPWILGVVITAWRYAAFTCPRCEETYFCHPYVVNFGVQRCMHCAFPRCSCND